MRSTTGRATHRCGPGPLHRCIHRFRRRCPSPHLPAEAACLSPPRRSPTPRAGLRPARLRGLRHVGLRADRLVHGRRQGEDLRSLQQAGALAASSLPCTLSLPQARISGRRVLPTRLTRDASPLQLVRSLTVTEGYSWQNGVRQWRHLWPRPAPPGAESTERCAGRLLVVHATPPAHASCTRPNACHDGREYVLCASGMNVDNA